MLAVDPAMRGSVRAAQLHMLRRVLDNIYLWAGYAAAICMMAILLTTIGQVVSRYLGLNFRGLTNYAGYFMAGATFMALAHTLNNGTHIRIETFSRLLGRYQIYAETWALGCTTLIAGWFAYYSCNMVYWSYKYNDVSTGMDALPMWIPQMSMAVGAVLFALALADNFLQLLFTGKHGIRQSTEIL
jgi:TRAP-type C4-dicarboxylate transport system permease small subunit